MNALSDKQRGTLALAAAVAGTSFSALLNRFALLSGMHPVWVNLMRLAFTAVLTALPLAFSRAARDDARAMSRGDAARSALSGLFLAGHFTCWVLALQRTDAFTAMSVWSTYVLMSAAGAAIFQKERTSPAAWAGLCIAVAGVALGGLRARAEDLSGMLWALGAAATQAGYGLLGRSVRRRASARSYTLVVYASALAAVALTALCMRLPPAGADTAGGLLGPLGLAVLCTLCGHTMASVALKTHKAPVVSAVLLTEVVLGPLWTYLFLGETPGSLASGAVIVLGVACYLICDARAASLRQSSRDPAAAPSGTARAR